MSTILVDIYFNDTFMFIDISKIGLKYIAQQSQKTKTHHIKQEENKTQSFLSCFCVCCCVFCIYDLAIGYL